MIYQGRLVKKDYAVGSKSEHESFMLETPNGVFKLVRKGKNPFSDPELEVYLNKNIDVDGVIFNNQIIATSVVESITPEDLNHSHADMSKFFGC